MIGISSLRSAGAWRTCALRACGVAFWASGPGGPRACLGVWCLACLGVSGCLVSGVWRMGVWEYGRIAIRPYQPFQALPAPPQLSLALPGSSQSSPVFPVLPSLLSLASLLFAPSPFLLLPFGVPSQKKSHTGGRCDYFCRLLSFYQLIGFYITYEDLVLQPILCT